VNFHPEQAPARLSSLREKAECLRRLGIDRLHVFRFDRAFSALSAEAFIEQVLGHTLQARYVLVGDDFRYGAKRAGDFALLKHAGQTLGFDAEHLPTVEIAGERASSTAVRRHLPRVISRTLRSCSAGPIAFPVGWSMATSWGATSASPPPTSNSSTTGRR